MQAAFNEHCAPRAHLRVRNTFEDFDLLAELHAAAAREARDVFESTSDQDLQIRSIAGRRADALHRALIEVGHRAVTVALHEVTGRPSRELTVIRQLERPASAAFRAKRCWQGLYCLAVFRNKIVIHHEVPRTAASTSNADGVRRLVPLPEEFHLARGDALRLRDIRDAGQIGIGLDNDFEILEALFYEVPVALGGPRSALRKEVDVIAERGGVKSPSVDQVREWILGALPDLEVLAARVC